MRRRKVGQVPGESCKPKKIKEQETFEKEKLKPRLKEANNGKRTVFLMDAAHFIYGAFLGFCGVFVAFLLPLRRGDNA